jgi:hypothetical protein
MKGNEKRAVKPKATTADHIHSVRPVFAWVSIYRFL